MALTLSAMGFSSASAQTAASAVDGKKQTLFSSVNHASKPYRIPAIATLNNGTVLAIADQRPCGADVGNGEVDIYAKVGTIAANGSYSWNPATNDPSANGGLKIADGTSSNGYGDAAVVVDRESGKVLVISVAGKVVFSNGSSSKHNKMARIVGSADGLSWESPQDVSSAFFANELSSAYTMFMASGRMIQSQKVKVGNYYRIYGALLVREKKNILQKINNNYVVYSDDLGATWKVLGGTKCVSSGDEAKVEELPNGDIVLSSRTSGGRYYNVFNFSNLNSASGSWGSATKYSFGGSNSTNGELMLYKGLVDANGTEYNVMFQSLPTGSSRSNVAVYYKAFATSKSSWAVSDFTSGWTKGIEVDNGASGYSTMTILPNGQVGFLYEDDYDTSKADGDYCNIVYVPLTVEEITGGKFSAPAAQDAQPVVVETPAINPAGGEVEVGTTVTVSCATDGATIYYTTNGSTPTTSSTKYTGAIAVNSAMTIKAIATKSGNYTNSEVATASFTIKAQASFSESALFDTPFQTTYNNVTLSMPYRIPALVETVNANGEKELIYFADKRHCGMDIGWGSSSSSFGSYYRIDIVARRSTDGGNTWTAEETIKQGTASCGYGDVAVVSNHENPKEIVFMAATGNVRYGNSTRSNPIRTTRFYSNDGGQSWSSTDMTSAVYNLLSSTYTGLFFTSGRICQSSKIKVGTHYRLYSALCVYNGSTSNAFVVYSDDFGASWNLLGGGIAVSGGDESAVEELPNGNVVISSRKYSSPGSTSTGRRSFRVFKYNSLPTAANTASGSWESSTYSGIQWQGTWKGTNGELLLVPAKDASGNSCYILLNSVPYGTSDAEGRGNVSIFWKKLSSDAITSAQEFSGTNWNRYSVSTTTSAYSTMVLQHDGTIAFAYEETIWGKGYNAPADSYSAQAWTELGYDLQYKALTLETITGNQYSYYEREDEPVVEVVETPAFSIAGGEVEEGTTVTVSCATEGATIYYTTNGSTPTASSTKYTGAITVNSAMTIKAIATKSGNYTDSEVATATFTIKAREVVAAPAFSIAGGEVEEGTQVTISCATEGATVYYTTDGSTPTTSSAVYSGAITVNKAMTIKAIAAKSGYYTNSSVATATFTIKAREVVAAPTFSIAGGEVEEGTAVTISCATSGATVYYTTDGSTPTTSSTKYTGAITVNKAMTIKAIAAKSGYYTNSSVATATFTIKAREVVATPVINPAGGEVEEGAAVTISCATSGATVYYTTDGSIPTTSSAVYSGAIAVNKAMTIKAIAAKNGYYTNSAVAEASYTIKQVVVEPEVPETPVIDAALQNAIDAALAVSAYSGVGYPSSNAATRVALDNAIANAQAGKATASDLEKAVSAFKNEVNEIQMPENGVKYKFVNLAQNGTKYYIKYASSGISMTTSESQATEYTCKVIDAAAGEYAFVTSDGKYLVWKGPDGTEGILFWKKTHGYNSNKGYNASYNSTYCDLIVEKLTNETSTVSASSNADLFGMMTVSGMRYSRSEYGYFTIKSNGTFDASATPYYNGSYSSAFYIVASGAAAKGSRIEGTTAVEEVSVEPVANDAIYDLTGRKVTEMRAGHIYIQNGKKVYKK